MIEVTIAWFRLLQVLSVCQVCLDGQSSSVQGCGSVESSLQVTLTHPSPCATPALSPQTLSVSNTGSSVRHSEVTICPLFVKDSVDPYVNICA